LYFSPTNIFNCRFFLDANTKRDQGKKAQFSNIFAAKVFLFPYFILSNYFISISKTIADTIRTCLGPRAMLKVCFKFDSSNHY
jgi:hypothetical protein